MDFKETIYNYNNLREDDMHEKTVRARAIMVNSNNEVLMCYSNGRNHYEFPGGHLEKNESLFDGLRREILEETGILISEESAIPFYVIRYYCKNYFGSGKNRLVEIYYYIIHTDMIYDTKNINLDINEKLERYECVYVPLDKLEEILESNKNTTMETDTSLDDTLLVYREFLNRGNYRK